MAANIEIKAKVPNFAAFLRRAAAISDRPGELIEQEDTFFNVPHGRLKLRIFDAQCGELIYYERADTHGPRQSSYQIAHTHEPLALKTALTAALGVGGFVKKRRTLFLTGQTRIHADEVEGLGTFMELEYVLRPDESPENGLATVHTLMEQLGITSADLLDKAYVDLLQL